MEITQEIKTALINFQRNEITEHFIYEKLSRVVKDPKNSLLLEKIAADELTHYQGWKKYTQIDVQPYRWKIFFYYWISRLFGITFGVQLMENGEETAQKRYGEFRSVITEIESYIKSEQGHEEALIKMIDEEHLRYVGSIVLGLNDALVELTGALAGFTLALQNTKLIAMSGAITGVAAALSMAASEYLSTRTEETSKDPKRAAIYTGVAYIFTVLVLITPYLIIQNYLIDLALVMIFAVTIIALFNYYISVVRKESFNRRFLEMAGVSLGVAAISFFIGYLFRLLLGIDV